MERQGRPAAEAHASSGSRGRAVDKLKSVVMKCVMGSAPADSRSLRRIRALIEERIHELVPTPRHPPYAWMIENAIKELNGEGCPDEEAISKFILAEYKDLPWAHPAFLSHHLKRLNLTHNHDKLTPTPTPTPVSSFSPTYASTDSSSSIQSFVQERRRKKKMKGNCGKKRSQGQKKSINARGMINCCDGTQVGGDIGLDGMREVDILSLLTEDEDEDEANLQQLQQIIVFEHQHGMDNGGKIEAMQQNMGDDHDWPTTFPEKTKRIRRKPRMRRGKRERESESNMNVDVNGVEQDSMDEQVYGGEGEPTDVERKESGKVLFQQNHYCPKPKPRPKPYRNVADIYGSSSTATRNTN